METPLLFNPLSAETAPVLPSANSLGSPLSLPTLSSARRASSAIAFVDGSVAQYQSLTTSIKAGIDVYVLDPLQDEVKQITQALAGRSDISSLYILSHGEVGGLKLGSLNLDLSDLGDYSADLHAWAKSLTANADVVLYGCNIASGDQGKEFVNALSQITGADIAASIDLTGNAAQGGNWDLEYATGQIESASALTANVLTAYQGLLVAPTITLSSTPLAYTENGSAVILANGATVQDIDSANFNTGKLTVSLSGPAGNDFNSDRLVIQTGNSISLDGKAVKYNNTVIGTVTGGIGSDALIITFNSTSATLAATQALLQQIAYTNVSDNLPASTSRTVQISLNDGTSTSTAVSRVINLTGVNDAPSIGQSLVLYNGNGKPETGDWLAYQDSSQFVGGVATETPLSSGGITLTTGKDANNKDAYAGFSNYAVNYSVFPPSISTSLKNPNFPVLDRTQGYVLSFTAGVSAENHNGSDRNLDGKDDRAGFSVVVVGNDQKAIELDFWTNRIFAQDDGTTQANPALEADGGSASATRTLFTQAESVNFNTTTSTAYDLAVLGNSYTLFANGQAILSGNLRDYTAFVPQNITLGPVSVKPPSPYAQKNLIFLGDNSSSASATLQLLDVAITTNSALPALTVNENTPLVIPNLLVADIDSGANPVTVTLSATKGKLTVGPAVSGGATVGSNGTSTVTLTGALTQINTTLVASGLSYLGNLNTNGTDTLSITVNDGGASGGAAQSTPKTLSINITPVNDRPTLDLNSDTPGTGYVANFTQGGSAVAIGAPNKLILNDVDGNPLASATITIKNPRNLGSEILAATTTGTSITATYDATKGILNLTGSDSVANYQKVLRTLTYNNSAAIPDFTTRTINFVVNDGSLNSEIATTTVILQSSTALSARQMDFTGDGKADIVWRNDVTGEAVIWGMNGFTLAAGAYLPKVDGNWRIEATADFDGNGLGDLLWRNYTTKEIGIWRMNGTTIAETALLPSLDFDWQIVGTGDFNGDRKDDLLFRNSVTGENAVWLINGVKLTEGYYITPAANSNWRVLGVGDFNGDGTADIVWNNETLNQNGLWLMNGRNILTAGLLTPTDAAWHITAIGDFNGDGKADLVWHNVATGENGLWLMDGLKLVRADLILPKVDDQNWQIVGTGDFDRDGKADLLWRNYSSGENGIWQMDGPKVKIANTIEKLVDLNWYIS